MSNQMPRRGRVTDALIAHLESALEFPVGDGTRPETAGWQGGQPGQGDFVASVMVSTGEGAAGFREPVNSRHSSWRLLYGLSTAGGTRSQADDKADDVREAVLALPHGTGSAPIIAGWRLTDVVFERQAPVGKESPTDAANWKVDDVVALWLDRIRD